MTGAITTRSVRQLFRNLTGQHFGGERDLYEVFGYPRALDAADYFSTYLRQDIAGRIVDAFPGATWREDPIITSDDGNAQLEDEIAALNDRYYLWSTLERLDRLMGLGHYAVLLIGLSGGESPREPTRGSAYDLLYLQPHGELTADIQVWNSNPRSPRYGKPNDYLFTTGVDWVGRGGGQRRITAHWSRTLHVAERPLDDESIGTPRLERIYNRLMDLDKLLGGSAEVYWQMAAMIRAWVADADAEWEPEDQAAMEAQFEELMHGLRRDLRLRGVTPHSLAGDAEDPSGHIDKQLEMIAGAIGMPKRILIGSERGELSSEQDENNWAGRIQERRTSFAGPRIIRPLIDRFRSLGIIKSRGAYTVDWPDSDVLGEQALAEIAAKKAAAIQAYVSVPGSDLVVPVPEFRKMLGLEAESEFEFDAALERETDVDETDDAVVTTFRRMKANAKPRALYVRRPVLNADAIRAHFKDDGLGDMVPADEMHVTICYSRTPVDWMRAGGSWTDKLEVPAGGPRVVEHLGPSRALVLFFACSELDWRHEDIKRTAGASWDHPSYSPHITLTYEGGGYDAESVDPYRGEIILGPEIFEEPDLDYSDSIVENRRA